MAKIGAIKATFPSGINKLSKGTMDGKMSADEKRTNIPTGLKDLSKYQDDKLSGAAKIPSFPVKKQTNDLVGKMSDKAKLPNFPAGLKSLSKDQNDKTTNSGKTPSFPTGFNKSPNAAATKIVPIKSPNLPTGSRSTSKGDDPQIAGAQASSRGGLGPLFVKGEEKNGVKDFLPAGFDKRSGESKIESKITTSAPVGLKKMSLDKTYKSVNGESSASIPSAPNKFPKGSLVGGGLGKSGGEASSKAGEGVSAPSFRSGRNKLSKGTEYSRNDLPDSIADKFSGIPIFPKVKEFSKSKLTGKDNGPDTFPAIKKFSKDALSKSPIKVGIDASKSADAIKSAMPLTTIRAPKEASEDMASKSQFMNMGSRPCHFLRV